MFIKQGKSNVKYILIVVILAIIVGVVIGWNYWPTLQEKELQIEKPQEQKIVELENKQYRREIVFDLKNTEILKDFQICLKLDTLSLIREGKLSFDCGNIKFTDSDGKTEIPYWIEDECGKRDTKIWVRVPEILPQTKKSIYIYYGNENKPSTSNFDEVFKTNDNLVGWYFFDELKVTDLSMSKNNGNIVGLDYYMWPLKMELICENNNRCFVFLDNWGVEAEWTDIDDAYFEIPSKGLNFDKSQGSIEMWIKPHNVNSGKYQRLIIDTNWDIELGINPTGDLYFYPAQAPKNNYNLIKNPLKNNEWNHIIVTWNFESREVIFYINGEKKENDIDNVSKYWKKTAQTGNWQIGGTSLDVESAFVGYIDGLRIYNKVLDSKEVRAAYQYNSRNSRYPTISFGEEKSILVEKVPVEVFDLSIVKNINLTNKINVSTCYATPLDSIYSWAGYPCVGEYIEPLTNENLFLISKHEDRDIPIFGTPSHFFPYEGTLVEFKDSFLLSYIGLEIKNPRLIKDLKIKFMNFESYEYGVNKYFEKLIPKAYACFPLYHYKVVGDSELSLIGEKEGIYWYKLKNPIFVDKATTLMQLYYKPTGEEGMLSLRVVDMVFIDKDKKFVRPTFSKDLEKEGRERSLFEECPFSEKYLAYLAKEEKGAIVFKQNLKTQELELSFENLGKDSITIDNQSIWNIETQSIKWVIKDIKIQDLNGNIISKISMDEIKNQIFGKKIEPNKAIRIPFVSLNDLQKNTSYYITIGTGEESNLKEITNQNRIIHWIFGDNPYYYPQYRPVNDLYLYRVNIDQDGSISFEEVRTR
uniref:DUF2341 domain-containing protein n=1 Tax=candidate division WOR-3 bacterium TaxID=2052148 RepID=A0A7C2K468_UNCW3